MPEQKQEQQPVSQLSSLGPAERGTCSIASNFPTFVGIVGLKYPTCEQYERVLQDPLEQLKVVGNADRAQRIGYENVPDRTRRSLAETVIDRAITSLPEGMRTRPRQEEPLAHQILGEGLASLERELVFYVSRRVSTNRPDLAAQYERQITDAGGSIPLLHEQANRYNAESRRLAEESKLNKRE